MIDLIEIIYAVIKQLKKCLPTSKHYLGKIPENFKAPGFLYILVFNSDEQSSAFTKDTTLDLQIIYFGSKDGYGVSSFEEKLYTMNELKSFLSHFNLQVKDRNLKFKYNFSEADEQLVINMQFKFKDGLVNLAYDEEQQREMMEHIYINEKEVI